MQNMAQNERESLDWHTYEREILDLFVSQNMKLPEVMAHMEAKHNFHAR
jgi:hypothetical protein